MPGRRRALALAASYLIYALLAIVVYVGARAYPSLASPMLIEVAGEGTMGVVALLWSVLLFRDMDNLGERLLIFTGIGLVFLGSWEVCLSEFYRLPLAYDLLENTGVPIGFALLTGGLAIRMIHHRAYANRLKRERDQIEDLAARDPLTSLYNRRFLRRELESLLANADTSGEPVCLCFIDADNFKEINDRHGHDTGDAFLTGLSRVIAEPIRDSDMAVRFGGDEFVVVLVGAGVDHAVHVAERIQSAVRRLGRPYSQTRPGGGETKVSVSIGIAAHAPGETGLQLIARADEAMYAAKREGRDRIAVA